ncbi:MAG: efflux RND transporter periplasmic adaptor subunit [Candidatus Pacebacteria bacterium]|nr:efflux RND transporter periplasmic adaptor subunit [Candidatus Paceibacterota bacterium]
MKKLFLIIKKRKIIFGLIVIALVVGGYFGFKALKGNKAETRYVLAAVEKGTLITSVSGSGQIAANNQVDIKPKASGEITAVYAALSKEVGTGALLVQVDTQDAEKAVRDAQTALETANLELDSLLAPADELTLFQAENSLQQANDSQQTAQDNLQKSYEDGFNAVSNAFLNLPTVMAGLNDIILGNSFNQTQVNINYYADAVSRYDENVFKYSDDTNAAYQKAREAYDANFQDYKSISRFSSISSIEALIGETYETTKSIAEAVRNANNLIQFYQDKLTEHNLKPSSLSSTHLSSLNSYTGTANSTLSTLLSNQQSIKNYKDAIVSAANSIKEKTLSLEKIKAGADELSVRAKKIAIQQKEDALLTAQQTLADCSVRAPFAGIIVKVSAKKGDTASSGTSLATLATKQKVAEISLNEVDIAQVKSGQKATLTFDAVPDLSITGEVAEVDSLGTVSQGVVTYSVKIVFDTQDDRIKPGMSISAAIITQAKQDVLTIPNSAIKSAGENYYVEMLDETASSTQNGLSSRGVASKNSPRQQPITIGSANDSITEVLSGLKEGDMIVSQTITATINSSQESQSSSLRIPGITTGGGGGAGGATFQRGE